MSLASEFQESLGVKLGDQLTFDIAGETPRGDGGQHPQGEVGHLPAQLFHRVRAGVLEGAAGTYMTSAYFTPGAGHSLAQLAHRFPSVSIFDIDDLLTQVRAVLDKAALAVQSVFLFTLLAGLTVLLAAVQSSREERRYESAMLRTLGASRATVVQGVLAEFTTLGALAGLLAALGASVGAYFLTTRWLELRYTLPVAALARGGARGGAAGGSRRLAGHALGHQPAAAEDAARLSAARHGLLSVARRWLSRNPAAGRRASRCPRWSAGSCPGRARSC